MERKGEECGVGHEEVGFRERVIWECGIRCSWSIPKISNKEEVVLGCGQGVSKYIYIYMYISI